MRLEQEKAGSSSSSSSAPIICGSCKEPGHLNAKSKECLNYKATLSEMLQKNFGGSMEQFTRKLYLESVLRPSHKALFTDKVIKLSEFIRNVTFRAQIFVSSYIILNQDSDSLSAITQQNFWYSVSQLIMGQEVTNKKFLSNEIVFSFVAFRQTHPSILFTLKDHKITGYSDSLSAACVTLATTHLNHIVENFERRIVYFIQIKLKDVYKVKRFLYNYT